MPSLAGNFLIARKSLCDGFFCRSVILLLEHNESKAVGLVLNRPIQAEELPFPLFQGGPCELDGLAMIHGRDEWVDDEDETKICAGIYLGTPEQFEKATETKESAEERVRIFTGYAGWGPQQLEAEMADGAWIVVPANGDVVFDTPVQDLWERLAPPTLPQPSMN